MHQAGKLFSQPLADKGINLQAVFSMNELPGEILNGLAGQHVNLGDYRQLILLGHGGTTLWEQLGKLKGQPSHPIDDYTIASVRQSMEQLAVGHYTFIYPGPLPISLQRLGELADWHHETPLRVGINHEWGTWFAYRAVLLADSDFTLSPLSTTSSPCDSCDQKPCISQCPAQALADGALQLQRCLEFRQQENSVCGKQCLARLACPVASEHRYSAEQLHYHYNVSMKMIKEHASR